MTGVPPVAPLARVFAIVPCRNRRDITLRGVADLVAQEGVDLHVFVVDDGSSDGTVAALRDRFAADKVTVIEGGADGDLWWTGAIALGARAVEARINATSAAHAFVLLQNDDTRSSPNHVHTLVETSARYSPPAAVGSPVRDLATDELVSIGPVIDWANVEVRDALSLPSAGAFGDGAVVDVDTLSGRGTLIPWDAWRAAGGVRPRLFPHYGADYDLGVRVRRAGIRTVIACDAPVWTDRPRPPATTWRERAFSRRSVGNLRDLNLFFLVAAAPNDRARVAARLAARFARVAARGLVKAIARR